VFAVCDRPFLLLFLPGVLAGAVFMFSALRAVDFFPFRSYVGFQLPILKSYDSWSFHVEETELLDPMISVRSYATLF
jgi:hypothetical protein